MGIKANFTKDDLRKRIEAFVDVIKDEQIRRMKILGEKCLIEARVKQGYETQTGALNSSTGFMIFVDGVAVHREFSPAENAQSDAAQKGMTAGQTIAESLGRRTKGVALVVVAGMNYASYVEAKGYNVLSSAERLAERELPKLLEKLVSKIKTAVE